MKGFVGDIEQATQDNRDFRHVVYTARHMQLVLMTLQPNEEIGEEVHEHTDQFFRLESGSGEIVIDGQAKHIESGVAMVVPAGARHNVKNTGLSAMHIYTVYAPPQHADGTVHRTRAQAEAAEEHFTGKTTE